MPRRPVDVTMKPAPETTTGWAEEIAAAYRDAREALPFMPFVGVLPRARDLFHLAPHVAIKFRGLPESQRQLAVEAALSTYVASEDRAPALRDPYMAFALCYLASHYGLDLVTEEAVDQIMDHLLADRASSPRGRRGMPNNEMHLPRSAKANRRGPRR